MRTLSKAVAANPDAKAGLQRAVAEYVLRDLKGNAQGMTSAESYLRGEQFQNLMARSAPALREVLSPEQMQSLQNVADSLSRSNLSVGGTKLAGGSDRAQNFGAQHPTLLSRLGQGLTETLIGGGSGAGTGRSWPARSAAWSAAASGPRLAVRSGRRGRPASTTSSTW